MRIFVTGGTGYLGSAVVRALVDAGHEVAGLVRSAEAACRLRGLGAAPVPGDLRDPGSFADAAATHDALLHLGIEAGPERLHTDRIALEGLLAAARAGVGPRCVVYTSTTFVLGDTGDTPADEEARPAEVPAYAAPRLAHERIALEAADERIATAVVRPGMVYGGGDGMVGELLRSAVEEGAATYVGSGENRWPLVHRDDLAELYRRVAERSARGIFHAADGTALRVAEVARALSTAAGRKGATRSLPLEAARGALGGFADALCLDQVVASPRSAALGWAPLRPPLPRWADGVYREWRGEDAPPHR